MGPNWNTERIRGEFAERLHRGILELGIQPHEQKRLGELFEVSGQAVRRWLEGSSLPTRTHMAAAADALGVRRAWLEYGEPPMRPQQGVAEGRCGYREGRSEAFALEAEEARLLTAFRRLDAEQRAALERIIEDLAAVGGGARERGGGE